MIYSWAICAARCKNKCIELKKCLAEKFNDLCEFFKILENQFLTPIFKFLKPLTNFKKCLCDFGGPFMV